jgi:hypothetical protein
MNNYNRPGETRVCQNGTCLRPLAANQRIACSVACYRQIMSDKYAIWLICPVCKKKFKRTKGQLSALTRMGKGKKHFCSNECQLEGLHPRPNASVICGGCGLPIDLNHCRGRIPKYHDRACMTRAFTGRPHGKKKTSTRLDACCASNENLNSAFAGMEGIL